MNARSDSGRGRSCALAKLELSGCHYGTSDRESAARKSLDHFSQHMQLAEIVVDRDFAGIEVRGRGS